MVAKEAAQKIGTLVYEAGLAMEVAKVERQLFAKFSFYKVIILLINPMISQKKDHGAFLRLVHSVAPIYNHCLSHPPTPSATGQ